MFKKLSSIFGMHRRYLFITVIHEYVTVKQRQLSWLPVRFPHLEAYVILTGFRNVGVWAAKRFYLQMSCYES